MLKSDGLVGVNPADGAWRPRIGFDLRVSSTHPPPGPVGLGIFGPPPTAPRPPGRGLVGGVFPCTIDAASRDAVPPGPPPQRSRSPRRTADRAGGIGGQRRRGGGGREAAEGGGNSRDRKSVV